MSPLRFRGGLAAFLILSALGAGLGLCVPPAQTVRDGKAAWKDGWEGPWTGVVLITSGRKFPEEEAQLLRLTFRGGRVTRSFLGNSEEGTFTIDPSKQPKQFELQMAAGQPRPGIYKLEKDTLTLCFSQGGRRPMKFEAPPGTRNVLLVLKRGAVNLSPAEERRIGLAARKTVSVHNLKQLALATFNYADTHEGRLPGPAIMSKGGKPLLSWRVAILPFLGEKGLYRQFKLGERWDSPHNKKLIAKIPKVYAPVRSQSREPGLTYYQTFVGPGTAFEPGKQLHFPASFPDGTSSTVQFVEAGEAVPWTKPADLPYDPKKALPKLGGLFPGGFHIALMDCSVKWVNRRFDERTFRLAITRDDGQKIDLDKLNQ
jgi:uncharacterized protein (TIGR03067 family)